MEKLRPVLRSDGAVERFVAESGFTKHDSAQMAPTRSALERENTAESGFFARHAARADATGTPLPGDE